MAPNSEQEFVRLAAQCAIDAAALGGLARISRTVNWPAALAAASAHHVTSLVLEALIRLPPDVVPEAAKRDLDARRLSAVAGSLVVLSEIRSALDQLQAAGLRAALAATPDAVLTIAGTRGCELRKATLFVAPDDLARARDALIKTRHFVESPAENGTARFIATGRIPVILETTVVGPSFAAAFPIELALDRAIDARVANCAIRTLGRQDQLVALCARAAPKGWGRLDYIVAVAELCREPCDCESILELARRAQLRRAVLIAAELVRVVLDLETPLAAAADRDWLARRIGRTVGQSLFDPTTRQMPVRAALLQLAVRDAVADRVRYLADGARRAYGAWSQKRMAAGARTAPLAVAPRKLMLRQFQSPGDLIMLTAALRDLHVLYPGQYLTDVRTSCPDLWLNNPYVTPLDDHDPQMEVIDCEYPLIHRSNQTPVHFIHGFIEFLNERLGLHIRPTAFKGDIHLSDAERHRPSPVCEITGNDVPYWIVCAGGKYDFTIKWWSRERYQAVVDHFRERLLFVQIGEMGHYHPPLEGVIDLRGKTGMRDLIRLVHGADGVIAPVSLAMHLAAAVETRPGGRSERPAVVIAGGREPVHWEAYPGHQFLHTIGALACCESGGCWRSRTLPIEDGDSKDDPGQLCLDVIDGLPRCMDSITAEDVIRQIERYIAGDAARPLTSLQRDQLRNVVTRQIPDRPHAGVIPLPIWCEPARPVDRALTETVTICVVTSGDHLDAICRCLESIRRYCSRNCYRLVVGASAISPAVRHYLYSERLSGNIDGLHESPVMVDKRTMMRRLLMDAHTEYAWCLDDDSPIVGADALERRLAIARSSPDGSAHGDEGFDGSSFRRTAVEVNCYR